MMGLLDSFKLPSLDDIVKGIQQGVQNLTSLVAGANPLGELKVVPYLSPEQQKAFVQQVTTLPSWTPTQGTPITTQPTGSVSSYKPISTAITQAESQALQQGAKTGVETFVNAMQPQNIVPPLVAQETKQASEKVVTPAINITLQTLGETAKATGFTLDENTKKLLLVGGIVVGGLIIYGAVK